MIGSVASIQKKPRALKVKTGGITNPPGPVNQKSAQEIQSIEHSKDNNLMKYSFEMHKRIDFKQLASDTEKEKKPLIPPLILNTDQVLILLTACWIVTLLIIVLSVVIHRRMRMRKSVFKSFR
ncbi:hypothetical protein O9G_005406 [Rozella allomycis CSF55]|uniref:Uncharacterized protein n=1 Tax=Rozella allomycis (strain CSF55) TaxID=988480 RepID=A0A075B413_ROZAC|nr:hypothetical protein O9G_005406 [Rozella allomycis CSF55]|eukprot:EPZ35769.1 hypothetical protein O9G_005406 [Rozella allomycis CSF55]